MKRVYFIRPVDCEGPVKIGCSVMEERRPQTMSAWSPIILEIAASFPGGHDIEVALHHRFAHLALHGEWFGVDDDMAAMIADIRAGNIPSIEGISLKGTTTRQVAGIKSSITVKVSNAERRVFSHRLNVGTGRPEHIRQILDRFAGPSPNPPTPDEQRQLAAYVAELRSKPPFSGGFPEKWKAWTEYRDGPNGLSALSPSVASQHAGAI